MDRNGLVGLLMIGAILIGWQYFTAPTAKEIAAQKAQQDSMQLAQKQIQENVEEAEPVVEVVLNDTQLLKQDSLANLEQLAKYGSLASASIGIEETFTVQTEILSLTFTNKGGRLLEAKLKDYNSYDDYLTGEDNALVLVSPKGNESYFNFPFENRNLKSDELYFQVDGYKAEILEKDSAVLRFTAKDEAGRDLTIAYTIHANNYLLDYEIGGKILSNTNELNLTMNLISHSKEKGKKFEKQNTTFFYKPWDDKVDYLSETSDDDQVVEERIDWISYKEQHFSVILDAEYGFNANQNHLVTRSFEDGSDSVKALDASLVARVENGSLPMHLYLGPNKYKTLKDFDRGYEDQINLGWAIFKWVNKFIVIPVFNVLENSGLSYGIVIIILTLVFKLLLSPVTYKTYLSSAKMKALKPEMEEINKKYPDQKDAMGKQQEVMKLYRETEVNPLSGCIPALVQLPILYALFRFFPNSIELRQESFLWAEDLSSFDSVWDFPNAFSIPLYGDHISGFTLMMAISLFFYSKNNMSMGGAGMGNNMQAQQMKIMTYMMPVMMLVFFNDYASGLSLYYFTSNMVTMGQQFVIKKWVLDETKIREKLQSNKANPKKKSRFAQKLENLQNQAQEQQGQNRQTRRKLK